MPHGRDRSTLTGYMVRLGPHHFAHLRFVAAGLDLIASAKNFLGVMHGHEAKTAHRQIVDAVRAVARRRGEPAWRLIGLLVSIPKTTEPSPTLDEFCEERGLDGWSENEVAQLYAEVYPPSAKAQRRARLRERQRELLFRLEKLAAEQPQPGDSVGGWFDDATAAKLMSADIMTLHQLAVLIAQGGCWYRGLKAVGKAKAARIAAYMQVLLSEDMTVVMPQPLFVLQEETHALAEQKVQPHYLATSGQQLHTDAQAIQAWIQARARSAASQITYGRELRRLLLWLQSQSKTLAQMSVADCNNYMAFLQDIPSHWISRKRAQPGQIGWAPFRGQLSHQSRRQAVVIIAAAFGWLQAAQYLPNNPWILVNQDIGDDPAAQLLDTKAFSADAMAAILRFIDAQAPSAARDRIRFVVCFLAAVGLRSTELLNARLQDLRHEPEGWVLQVYGKGARNRLVMVPGQALQAAQRYLAARGHSNIESAPPDIPLLAHLEDTAQPLGYRAFYKHVRAWLKKAIRAADLPAHEYAKLQKASTHWLRHTFGTHAVARNVPLDVIQAQLGHASIQTTMSLYGRAPIQRRAEEMGRAFG